MAKRKQQCLDSFFKKQSVQSEASTQLDVDASVETPTISVHPSQPSNIECERNLDCSIHPISTSVKVDDLERDPGLRPQMWDYSVNQRDEIRRAYLTVGPYQPKASSSDSKYPICEKQQRRFQASWFSQFPTWLEYSPTKDAAYCLPCYLFTMKSSGRPGWDVFIRQGFKNWKRVNDGKNCSFLNHIGTDLRSPHNIAVKSCADLMNQSGHIDKILLGQQSDQIQGNRLRVKTSIDVVRWLAFQGCAFRGHDESSTSTNRGNFLELIQLLSSYNEDVANVVLENAPAIAKYTSSDTQKEILHVIASKVRKKIREDIGDSKFCIIVDEARDESKREQMVVILRFVNQDGFIKEHFFDLAHVKDTTAATLKNEISGILSRYCLDIQNLRGQGYDGASNMRGEWKGLQALFIKECPCAYYIHCFAHRLQLALVAAAREVLPVHEFFSNLTFIVNTVTSSSKRHDELQVAQASNIAYLLATDELETGKGLNQIGTLKRASDTRWGSHFQSICSLLNMYDAICSVLENVKTNGSSYYQRGDASSALKLMTSFEFIFILHLVKEVMGITDVLCQVLQQKSQDILNALHLVSTSKILIQKLREHGWNDFIERVMSFAKKEDVETPDLSAQYIEGRGRRQRDKITMEHHYHFDIFNIAIDFQLQELNSRFNEQTMELLTLSLAMDPKDDYKSFNIEDICRLAEKFYPLDFSEHDLRSLKYQLQHFELETQNHPKLRHLSSLSELCQVFAETKMSKMFYLIDRIIRLILTLPVSTATGERAFSAMKIVKTRLRNKMEDEFLADNLVVYIEKEIAQTFSLDSILDGFVNLKERRVKFR